MGGGKRGGGLWWRTFPNTSCRSTDPPSFSPPLISGSMGGGSGAEVGKVGDGVMLSKPLVVLMGGHPMTPLPLNADT